MKYTSALFIILSMYSASVEANENTECCCTISLFSNEEDLLKREQTIVKRALHINRHEFRFPNQGETFKFEKGKTLFSFTADSSEGGLFRNYVNTDGLCMRVNGKHISLTIPDIEDRELLAKYITYYYYKSTKSEIKYAPKPNNLIMSHL